MFRYKDATHQDVGPVPKDEIKRLLAAGVINRNTQVRAEESVFWEPAFRCVGLADLFVEPTAAPEPAQVIPQTEPTAAPEKPQSPAGGQDFIEVESAAEPEPAPGPGPAQESASTPPQGEARQAESPRDTVPPKADENRRFFMIGGDGREYGPLTGEQLRSFIAQRRANAETKIRLEDGKDWAPLGAWPEFADALQAANETKTAGPPPLDSTRATQLADELIGRGYGVAIGACLSRSWELYTKNFGMLTGTTALLLILVAVPHTVVGAGNLISVVLSGVLLAGLSQVFLKTIRGQQAEVNDLFAGFTKALVPLLVAAILVPVLLLVAFPFCILPSVYLFVAWTFVYTLVLDRGFDFWPAMELSRRIIHERWWEMFVLWLIAGALIFVGLMVGVVGVFFTAPLAFGTLMYAYEDIFGGRPA